MQKTTQSIPTEFSLQDVVDGKIECSIDDWFRTFENVIKKIQTEKFQGATESEKNQFAALSYMACSAYAFQNDPRELSEKTFPHLQMAIIELQRDFKPFGLLLEAVQKNQFKKDMRSGLSNVEAVDAGKKRLRNAFDRSMFPEAFKKANMEIQWD